jgi:uncharacterized protein involved in type VI secretion and phage assembly
MTGLFSALLSDREDRQRSNPVTGVRFAEVTGMTDDGYQLRWLSGPVDSTSAPARAAAFMAGSERGAYFPFEVGDEVVVGFEDGHLDRPVILGALWSDQDRPPPQADTTSSNNIRTIVSRAGSEFTFDDTQGATKVTIKSAGGMEITLDDAQMKLTIKFDASNSIELSAAGVTVKGAVINLN